MVQSASETMPQSSSCIGILDFLRGKNYFITGATGFVAKVLIEKILRAVPKVGRIYLLIKEKDKDAAVERLKNEVIGEELFKCLKQIHGKSYEAFMMTANTTLDERYDVALNVNTQGPAWLLEFAKKCKNLKLFLHVSSAYVNGEREGIILERPFHLGQSIAEERIPPTSVPWLDVSAEIKLASDMMESLGDDNEGAQKMRDLGRERARIYGWQNTYVFTKAMGEMLINSKRENLPIVIIRPSIIESTYSEPFPGWIQENRVTDPVFISYGKGQLPGFVGNPKTVLDIIPVDMVVNAIIAAVAKHGTVGKAQLRVYHVTSSVSNPISFGQVFDFACDHFTSFPLLNSKGKIKEFKYFSSMDSFSSYIRDETEQQIGLNGDLSTLDPKLRLQMRTECANRLQRFARMAELYEPYAFYKGWFDCSNIKELIQNMSTQEKKLFRFDVESINWKHYIKNVHLPGLRRHVMKEKLVAVARL
ncbi:fatty acyl-CoA reductase 2, chloroplastic isoform X2 [Hevea brasiliensis]|uniref:fatty acyl-CoA reductase 2, chloroplastic isoform X2 n=1 Tax=Hevea brasiliensis TaxID=3981 RepID=UPI0025E4F734|nr:fatty acyl-CoA reductase 2, chloroplastic isoform X2 [Hevea brasiliensis]